MCSIYTLYICALCVPVWVMCDCGDSAPCSCGCLGWWTRARWHCHGPTDTDRDTTVENPRHDQLSSNAVHDRLRGCSIDGHGFYPSSDATEENGLCFIYIE